MKVTGVATTALADPHATACFVELKAGELTGVAVARSELRPQILRVANELLIGEDFRSATALWQWMMDAGAPDECAAALDIALWDLKAKTNGEPLWKALGACRPRVNAHIGGCAADASDEALLEWYGSRSRQFGFRAGTLRVGDDVPANVRRLGLMQQSLDSTAAPPSLMIDADARWSPDQAIQIIRTLERSFDITWVESPTLRTDFPSLKRISQGVSAAVCGGRGLEFPIGYLPHLKHYSLNIIQIDTARCGITGALQLADAAFGFELPVVLGESPGNFSAHVAAAMPNCMSLEVLNPLPMGYAADVSIVDGWAIAGDKPGNGLGRAT